MSVWSTGGNVSKVTLHLATSPSSQKPKFTSGCSKEGANSCSVNTVSSTQEKHTLRAQVPIAATATSVKSVKLTVTATGTSVDTHPEASVPIGVTAPKASSTPSSSAPGSSTPATGGAGAGGPGTSAPGTGVLTPGGVRSTLGVGGLPFVNSTGASTGIQPSLSPGGNASSLFPTLKPSGSSGQGSPSRIRPLADSLPGDASLMGAQYAGLAALAIAFILSVTRLSIRRRRSSPRPGA